MLHEENNFILTVADEYILNNKEDALMNLFSVNKSPGENKYFRNINYTRPIEDARRNIDIRFYPDSFLMNATQCGEYNGFSFSYRQLNELVDKKTCRKIYSSKL
jgi:hypothetical protein